ncbi:hypothetical protein C2G38_1030515 [Gigaspora rosea]|uniref:Uncharacterized protein n=1 Tax=Gigaspora rosea TaxID=44941 RepID=A0A397VSN6_9GLOM|nr:hypothetical protein C2G38_1030515 [Gigaspora rosea]
MVEPCLIIKSKRNLRCIWYKDYVAECFMKPVVVLDLMGYHFLISFKIINFNVYFFHLFIDDPEFRTTQVYVRNNIANLGNLKEGMEAPDCPLIPLKYSDITIPNISIEASEMTVPYMTVGTTDLPNQISLRSFCRSGRPLVLLAGSLTCPLYRYISHVLNDMYERYQTRADSI